MLTVISTVSLYCSFIGLLKKVILDLLKYIFPIHDKEFHYEIFTNIYFDPIHPNHFLPP